MFALRPLSGHDHHFRRIQYLRRLAEATDIQYLRYGGDGVQRHYIISHPVGGELLLGRWDVELYTAGYCAGMLAFASAEDFLVGMVPQPVTEAQNTAYYPGEVPDPPSGETKVSTRVVRLTVPGVGVVLVRRDYAATFLAAFHGSQSQCGPEPDRVAAHELLFDLLTPTTPQENR